MTRTFTHPDHPAIYIDTDGAVGGVLKIQVVTLEGILWAIGYAEERES